MHYDKFSVELCREHPRKIFVFGDNLRRKGTRGQAAIRNEPNAFGVATKIAPLMSPPAFFEDNDQYLPVIADDLFKIKTAYHGFDSPYTAIVFPTMGLGTGLAKLQEKSPTMWDGLGWLLYQYFGYINGDHSE